MLIVLAEQSFVRRIGRTYMLAITKLRNFLEARSIVTFCFVMAGIMLLLNIVSITTQHFLGVATSREIDFLDRPLFWGVIGVVIAPLVETAMMQTAPYLVMTLIGIRSRPILYLSMVTVFAGMHWSLGLTAFLTAGVIGGAALAFTFLRWSTTSVRKAYLATAATHAIYNAALIGSATAAVRFAS